MSETTLKGDNQYSFPAAPPLSSTSSFSTIVKFSDNTVGARPEHLGGCSRDYAKPLLTSWTKLADLDLELLSREHLTLSSSHCSSGCYRLVHQKH